MTHPAATPPARTTIWTLRSETQRTADGVLPGTSFVPGDVLEWRCDPTCPYDPRIGSLDLHLVGAFAHGARRGSPPINSDRRNSCEPCPCAHPYDLPVAAGR